MRRLVVLLFAPLMAFACTDDETTTTTDTSGRVSAIIGLTGDASAGSSSYMTLCGYGSPCHGADGTTPNNSEARDLSVEASSFTDAFIVGTVLDGQGGMPTQAHLKDQEISDILAYIRQEWGGP